MTAVIALDRSGVIVIELFPADAPKTVENFVRLARRAFYDGQRFHRVEDWVVQAGDPQSRTLPMDHERMGTGGPGHTITADVNPRLHRPGPAGLARCHDP